MATNKEIATHLLDAIGGKENIQSVAHCATRLRIMVHDQEKINQEAVEDVEKVKGAFYNSGQYQVIFGTGTVNQIYQEFEDFGVTEATKEEQKQESKQTGKLVPACHSYIW